MANKKNFALLITIIFFIQSMILPTLSNEINSEIESNTETDFFYDVEEIDIKESDLNNNVNSKCIIR